MKIQTTRHFLARLASRRAARSLRIAPLFGGCVLAVSSVQAIDTADNFTGGTNGTAVSWLTATNWSLGALPTASNDAVFTMASPTGTSGSPITLTASSQTVGSLDDAHAGAATYLSNATSGATASVLTLGGAGSTGNGVSGVSADLLYVAPASSTFNVLGGTTAAFNLVLGQAGSFNVGTGSTLNIGTSGFASTLANGGFLLTLSGAGAANIGSVISGTGGLTQSGIGTTTLSAANIFTGAININAGTLAVTSASALGTTGTVTFGGGTLSSTLATDFSPRFATTAGQAYSFSNSVAATFATALTSSGGTFAKSGAGVLTSTAANTFTGATTINAGSMALSGAAGSLASTAVNLTGGGLTLTNTGVGGNNANRIDDSANVTVGGGTFLMGGSDQTATNATETVGTLTAATGAASTPIVTVTPGTTGSTTLTAGSYSRAAGALEVLVNGTGLGSTAASTSRLLLTTAPTLVGTTVPLPTGINATAKDTQIALGLVGEATATTGGLGTVLGTANTFVTYTGTGGLRPLNLTDEYTQNAVTAATNVRTTAATAMAASTAINALVINGATAAANTLTLTGTLTDTSGMLLFAPTANVASTITGGTVAFGAREGLIYAGGTAGTAQVIASAVTGSNGLTIAGPGTITLSGTVTLSGGILSNTQHFLTLSGSNTLTGASVVSLGERRHPLRGESQCAQRSKQPHAFQRLSTSSQCDGRGVQHACHLCQRAYDVDRRGQLVFQLAW